MQRRNINTVACAVLSMLAAALAVIILLRNDTSSNSSILDSSLPVIQQFNNSSLLDNDTSTNYPWKLSGSSNETDDTNKDEMISYHDGGQISNFISITDIARGGILTPKKYQMYR